MLIHSKHILVGQRFYRYCMQIERKWAYAYVRVVHDLELLRYVFHCVIE